MKNVDKIVTRNINVLKQIILSGNAYRINKVFVDKSGKHVYRFYTYPEIGKIKSEGDKIRHEKWEKKQSDKKEKPINNTMKELIDKVMAEGNNATE